VPRAGRRSVHIGRFDFLFERCERLTAELIQPALKCAETLRIDVVDAPRPRRSIVDESRQLQRFEVLRYRRPADRQSLGNDAHGLRADTQPLEDLAPRRVAQALQCRSVSNNLR